MKYLPLEKKKPKPPISKKQLFYVCVAVMIYGLVFPSLTFAAEEKDLSVGDALELVRSEARSESFQEMAGVALAVGGFVFCGTKALGKGTKTVLGRVAYGVCAVGAAYAGNDELYDLAEADMLQGKSEILLEHVLAEYFKEAILQSYEPDMRALQHPVAWSHSLELAERVMDGEHPVSVLQSTDFPIKDQILSSGEAFNDLPVGVKDSIKEWNAAAN